MVPVCFSQIHTGVLGYYNAAGGDVTPPDTGGIFWDDFETGDFSKWDVENEEGDNLITAGTDTVFDGTYSAWYDWAGVDNVNYLQVDPAGMSEDEVYFRCYIKIDQNFRGPAFGHAHAVVGFFDGGTEVVRVFARTGNTDEDPDFSFLQWRLWGRGDAGHEEEEGAEQDGYTHNTWLRFEVGWEHGTGADGWATIKVDGDSIIGIYGMDCDSYFIDRIRVGTWTHYPIDDSYYWIDNILIKNDDWVGAKPE